MQVRNDLTGSYPQDPTRFFNFERLDVPGDFTLIPSVFDISRIDELMQPIVYLEFEEPNRFFVKGEVAKRFEYEGKLKAIFTLCPYTARWLNEREDSVKRFPIFFPFNPEHLPQRQAKDFDVIYTGGIHSPSLTRLTSRLKKFKNCCVSQVRHPNTTHFNVSYGEKLELISRSKVMIVHNLLYLNYFHGREVRAVPGFQDNEAFREVPRTTLGGLAAAVLQREILAPQLKSRAFEAAFCRSLILCRRDRWNVIEQFFTPGKEFVYFDDDTLEKTLTSILANYDSYLEVIERAYERASREYTTEAFARRYLQHF